MPNYRGDLSLSEVAKRAGASYYSAYHWARMGLRRPDSSCITLPCYRENGRRWVKPSDLRRFLEEASTLRRPGRKTAAAKRGDKPQPSEPDYVI